jgi:hypothetical protein
LATRVLLGTSEEHNGPLDIRRRAIGSLDYRASVTHLSLHRRQSGSSRFAAWILPFHKDRLELVPGTATRAQPIVTSWEQGSSFELNAPILDFTIQQALDDSFRAQIAATLKFWINNDMENIFRIKCGIHHFQVPYEYETNSVEGKGGTIELGGPFTEKSLERAKTVLKELLRHVTKHLHDKSDLVSAAVYATALLRLSLTYQLGEFTPHYSRLHTD